MEVEFVISWFIQVLLMAQRCLQIRAKFTELQAHKCFIVSKIQLIVLAHAWDYARETSNLGKMYYFFVLWSY